VLGDAHRGRGQAHRLCRLLGGQADDQPQPQDLLLARRQRREQPVQPVPEVGHHDLLFRAGVHVDAVRHVGGRVRAVAARAPVVVGHLVRRDAVDERQERLRLVAVARDRAVHRHADLLRDVVGRRVRRATAPDP
jgi:hypothetical protein